MVKFITQFDTDNCFDITMLIDKGDGLRRVDSESDYRIASNYDDKPMLFRCFPNELMSFKLELEYDT